MRLVAVAWAAAVMAASALACENVHSAPTWVVPDAAASDCQHNGAVASLAIDGDQNTAWVCDSYPSESTCGRVDNIQAHPPRPCHP